MNIKDLKTIIELFDSSKASKLKIEEENLKILLEKGVDNNINTLSNDKEKIVKVEKPIEIENSIETKEEVNSNTVKITSPIVGTFYSSPSPEEEPFVKVGDYVKEGQTLCIVEAMKMLNEIKSSVNGEIVNIYGENENLVEYGQLLFEIEEK